MPCLCISIFALMVTIYSFWLPETLHKHDSARVSAPDSYKTLEAAPEVAKGGEKPASKFSILRNWPLMSSIIVYCVFSLHDMAYTEIFSLWAESPRNLGGLSYSSDEVGVVLAVSGVDYYWNVYSAEQSCGPRSKGSSEWYRDDWNVNLQSFRSSRRGITIFVVRKAARCFLPPRQSDGILYSECD
nr:protein ZINC INDUCED FACILITATOR 1-like isoform X2 [Ipomoea batatas]